VRSFTPRERHGRGGNLGLGDEYDAIIVGSGMGGLSCGALLARAGKKVLLLEKHNVPGGYATTFRRRGGFEFDVSLHAIGGLSEERILFKYGGIRDILRESGVAGQVKFLRASNLYRSVFPDHDIRLPQMNLDGQIEVLSKHFPDERNGMRKYFDEMLKICREVDKLAGRRGKFTQLLFPLQYRHLFRYSGKTLSELLDRFLQDERLKAVASQLWGYYGLPPSRLSALYYAPPTMEYMLEGAWYPLGKSQALSNAFVRSIEESGGEVLFRAEVREILVRDGVACGVRTVDGREFRSDVIVSNIDAHSTFHQLVDPASLPSDYLSRVDSMRASLSCFQVYLGLSVELAKMGVVDHEIFVNESYDLDREYETCLNADVQHCPYTIMVYDNVYPRFSPEGKTSVTILALQGYDYWAKFEDDYRKGSKERYMTEKERMTSILIGRAERIIPNLSRYVELREASTPLTNIRYTENYRGAIYGWDQTVEQSIKNRLAAETPIKNLYLAGAWTTPGGGFSGAMQSGFQTYQTIMKKSSEIRT